MKEGSTWYFLKFYDSL